VPFGTRGDACRAEAALKKLSREEKLSWTRGEMKIPAVPGVEGKGCVRRGKKG
jgi:hypothetical protein